MFGDDGHSEEGLESTVQRQAVVDLQDLKRGDGIITMSKAQAGVLRTIISAIDKESDYRELLIRANFMSPDEADRAANALAWANRYGVSIGPILDKIAARCAVKAERVEQALAGLTTIRFQTNRGKGKYDNKREKRSPISE